MALPILPENTYYVVLTENNARTDVCASMRLLAAEGMLWH